MPITLHELLQPQVIVDTVSKLSKGKAGRLSQLFGWHLGGPNKKEVDTRYAEFRIFNQTREPAMFRAPGTGPAAVPPNPVAAQRVAMARVHEKIILDAEQLGNLSPIIGPNAQIDEGGKDYIFREESFLASKFANSIDAMTAGLIRGIMYLTQSGDNWIPYLASQGGTEITIDWQIPAGNKNQLNMTGGGNIIDTSWDSAAAPIVKHCLTIRAAFEQLTGMPLTDVLVNSTTLGKFINNAELRTVGGAVASVFDSFEYEDETDMEGNALAGAGVITFRSIPWLRWHIIDQTLSIGGADPVLGTGIVVTGHGTLTPVVPDNVVVFMPPIDRDWVTMWHGSEWIAENYGQPLTKKKGFQAWHTYSIEPSAVSLVALLNLLPVLYREKAIAPGTVIF